MNRIANPQLLPTKMYPLMSNDKKLTPAQVLEAHKGQPTIETFFLTFKEISAFRVNSGLPQANFRPLRHTIAIGRTSTEQAMPDLNPQDMLDIVAHDLRNPLMCIEGHATRLIGHSMTPPQREHVPSGSGRIEVTLHDKGHEMVVEITDNGAGIAPGQQARIFEKFYQVNSEDLGSLGLGLYICKRLINHIPAKLALLAMLAIAQLCVFVKWRQAAHQPSPLSEFRITDAVR